MVKHVKVAVTGAAGQIGYALLFRIASGQMFGADTTVDLHLIELEQALPALQGVVMELEDCAFPLLKKVSLTSDLKTGFSGVNWAILVGSIPRKQGMERADLLKVNGGIFAPQGKALNDYAADDVRIFVVGNPCNTNCLIALHSAPNIPRSRFYAMTMLDEKRARYQLAAKAGVSVSEVSQMTIWGNHSGTQYPDFYHANIKGQSAAEYLSGELPWLQTEFIPFIQQRGAAVIKARGASSAASAANAVIEGVYHLTHDTPAGETYSMALYSQGEYGIQPGLIFSYPCRTEQGQIKVVEGWIHNPFGQERLAVTEQELSQEKAAVVAAGFIPA